MYFVQDACIFLSRVHPYVVPYVTNLRCNHDTLYRPVGLFLILPLLIASHMPEDTDPESEDAKEETYCPSATVQISTASGYVQRTSSTGPVGPCLYWSVLFNAPVGGPEPTYFFIYEVSGNTSNVWSLRYSTSCVYQGECGRYWGSVQPGSRIVVIGRRYAGQIGGAVAELDTSTSW